MNLSSAFRIGTLLTVAIVLNQIVSISSSDSDVFVTRAKNFQSEKLFVKCYQRFTLPSDTDVAVGANLYSRLKQSNFQETGKAGSMLQLDVDKMKQVVDLWQDQSIVSSQEATNMRNILSQRPFKTILEHVRVRENGDFVYGITGFLETVADGGRKGSIFYAFRKFNIPTASDITYIRNGGTCKLWGQFCPTSFSVGGLSDSDSQSLFSYIRSETLKSFAADNAESSRYIETEAARYEHFVPYDILESLRKLDNNPNTMPDELLPEDPLRI